VSVARLRGWLPQIAAGVLVAAVIAVVLVIALTGSSQPSGAGSLPTGQAVAATWSLTPSSSLFGDTVHMRVEATVDRSKLDPRFLQLDAPLKPYEPVGPRHRTQKNVGRYTEVVYSLALRCIKQACVSPVGGSRHITLDPAHLVYRGPGQPAGFQPIEHAWPGIVSYSRLDQKDILAGGSGVTPFGQNPNRAARQPLPPWRFASDLPHVSYSVGPNKAFWYAILFALLLVTASAVLLRPYLPRLDFLRRREPGPLEIALATVERARASGRQERERQALELLGAELVRTGELQLAESARALAWSQPDPPEPALTAALTLDVRKVIEERSNGHGA
jgi:hypothetical protein